MLHRVTLDRAIHAVVLALGLAFCVHLAAPTAQAQDSTVVLKGDEYRLIEGQ